MIVTSDMEGTKFNVTGMRLPMNREEAQELCQLLTNSLKLAHEYREKDLSIYRNYDHCAQPVLPTRDARIRLHFMA